MKKICLLFNSLVDSNGVSRSVISIANLLSNHEIVEVTLIPLFLCSDDAIKRLNSRVRVKKVFGFYFKGFSGLCQRVPMNLYSNFLKLAKYDVVIAFQYGLATKIVAEASLPQNIEKIAWMHGYDNGLILQNCYKKIGHVVCVSKTNQDRLLNEMNATINVDYNYNPINDKDVVEEGKKPIPLERTNSPLFVTVGRHSVEKGYSRLIDIVQRLRTDNYKFELWFVGDGPTHNELKKKCDTYKLHDYIKFVGAQGNPHAYTSKADIFICSSFSEGYSTACTEAIMLGVPVVTTSVSGGKEIIDDAKAGLLTQTDDESLYEGIKYVLDNPQLVQEWKEVLKETKRVFSQEYRSKHLFEILHINNTEML